MAPLSVVSDKLLTECEPGATDSEATREAAPIFVERGAMFGGPCNGADGASNVENCGRGAVALRGVVRTETRQVYFQLGFLEGTSLCPCLILLDT